LPVYASDRTASGSLGGAISLALTGSRKAKVNINATITDVNTIGAFIGLSPFN
jgi:hypothetical protein